MCCFALGNLDLPNLWQELLSTLELEMGEFALEVGEIESVLAEFGNLIFPILGVFFIIMAVIIALYNIFAIGKIHKFVKSLYQSVSIAQFNIVKVKAAANWTMTLGIFMAISAVGSIENIKMFSLNACSAVACIFGSVLIKKYFNDLEFKG